MIVLQNVERTYGRAAGKDEYGNHFVTFEWDWGANPDNHVYLDVHGEPIDIDDLEDPDFDENRIYDAVPPTECAADGCEAEYFSSGWVCLDGGEEYCEDCVLDGEEFEVVVSYATLASALVNGDESSGQVLGEEFYANLKACRDYLDERDLGAVVDVKGEPFFGSPDHGGPKGDVVRYIAETGVRKH